MVRFLSDQFENVRYLIDLAESVVAALVHKFDRDRGDPGGPCWFG